MGAFKDFLEKKGHDLASQQHFMQYYALPYIPDPRLHPSFKEIFEPKWVMELQDKVKLTLEKVLNKHQKPELLELMNRPQFPVIKPEVTETVQLTQLKRRYEHLESIHDQTQTKLKSIQVLFLDVVWISSSHYRGC